MATRRIKISPGLRKWREERGIYEEEHMRVWKWLMASKRRKFLKSIGTPEHLIDSHYDWIGEQLEEMQVNSQGRTEAMCVALGYRNSTPGVTIRDRKEAKVQALEDLTRMEGIFNRMFDEKDLHKGKLVPVYSY